MTDRVERSDISMQFLLQEYLLHEQSVSESERTGETRVNFFLTLAAAVFAALLFNQGGLLTRQQLPRPEICAIVLAMLTFGRLTLARVVHRNLATDREIEAARRIRGFFAETEPWVVPFLSRPRAPSKTRPRLRPAMLFDRGGLAETVMMCNALMTGLLFSLSGATLVSELGPPLGLAANWVRHAGMGLTGAAGVALAWLIQQSWVNERYERDEEGRAPRAGGRVG